MLAAFLLASLLTPASIGQQISPNEGAEAIREQVLARLSQDRVDSVTIDEVELFPEDVAAVRGSLTLHEPHRVSGRLDIPFDLMVGNAVEADPQGYAEGDERDSPLNHHPKVLTRVSPNYPEQARKNGTAGDVRLFTLVRQDGSTIVLGVLTPLPDGCTEAAIEAVEKWTWHPRVFFGRETDALGLASVRFPPENE